MFTLQNDDNIFILFKAQTLSFANDGLTLVTFANN